jgi:hypothetical protein
MCALQILAKAVSIALLVVTRGHWLLAFFAVDHGINIVYKFARKDMLLWLPLPPAVSYAIALPARVVIKTISDFTASPLFRLPHFGGGAHWLFSLVVSQAAVFVCVHLYLEHADVGEDAEKIEAATLWKGAAGLAAGWLIAFSYFAFWIAVPELRGSLWSRMSGKQLVQNYFLKQDVYKTDAQKFHIFKTNMLLWESEIGEEVRAWAAQNWGQWQSDGEEWFQVDFVPDKFVPAQELQALGNDRRRRGSAVGSIRESFREVEGGGGEE